MLIIVNQRLTIFGSVLLLIVGYLYSMASSGLDELLYDKADEAKINQCQRFTPLSFGSTLCAFLHRRPYGKKDNG